MKRAKKIRDRKQARTLIFGAILGLLFRHRHRVDHGVFETLDALEIGVGRLVIDGHMAKVPHFAHLGNK